jgi:hypothetical protein
LDFQLQSCDVEADERVCTVRHLEKRANKLFSPEASKAFSSFTRYADGVLEETPQLYVASSFGLMDVVCHLVQSGADITKPYRRYTHPSNDLTNAFHAAACQDHLGLIDYKLKQGMPSKLGEKDIAIVLKQGKGMYNGSPRYPPRMSSEFWSVIVNE